MKYPSCPRFFFKGISNGKPPLVFLKLTTMMQTKAQSPTLENVGEAIPQELGAKMIKDFQDNFPEENAWIFVGKNILQQILDQPDCAGIRYYHALNEKQEKTLVYVGVNYDGEVIAEYTSVSPEGIITKHQGIVADRGVRTDKPPTPPPPPGAATTTVPEWTTLL